MGKKKRIDIEVNVDSNGQEAIDNLEESTGKFGIALGGLKSGFTALKKGLNAAKLGFTGLKGAIAATGIGLLLLAFTSLISFFTKTKKGAELLEVATAALGATFGVLTDLASKLGEYIMNAFTNPKKALSDLGDSIMEFGKNYVQSLMDYFSLLGSVISKTFSGDFSGALEDAGKAAKILVTEIIPVTAVISVLVEEVTELGTSIKIAANNAIELERAQQVLNDRIRDFGILQAGVMDKIDRLKQLSDDQTKSEQERIGFLQQAAVIESNIANERLSIAAEQVRIITEQNNLSDSTSEDLQRLADAEVILAEAKAASAKISTELAIKESAIRKQVETDRQDIIQQSEDIIIEMMEEGVDKKIAIIETELERKLATIKGNGAEEVELRRLIEEQATKEVAKVKKEAADAEEKLKKENFIKDTDRIKALTKEQGDAAMASAELAQQGLDYAIQINGILEDIDSTRINVKETNTKRAINLKRAELESGLINEIQFAEAEQKLLNEQNKFQNELAEKAFKRQQALAIVQAFIQGGVASVKALVDAPYPYNLALVALAVATTTASVASIASQKYSPTSVGAGGTSQITMPSVPEVPQSIVPSANAVSDGPTGTQSELFAVPGSSIEQIGDSSQGNGQRVYVVESDITDIQNRVADIDEVAQF